MTSAEPTAAITDGVRFRVITASLKGIPAGSTGVATSSPDAIGLFSGRLDDNREYPHFLVGDVEVLMPPAAIRPDMTLWVELTDEGETSLYLWALRTYRVGDVENSVTLVTRDRYDGKYWRLTLDEIAYMCATSQFGHLGLAHFIVNGDMHTRHPRSK
jgi:hypothetical protein